MFLPVKNFAHDNFFYKITTKKLRKFAFWCYNQKKKKKCSSQNKGKYKFFFEKIGFFQKKR